MPSTQAPPPALPADEGDGLFGGRIPLRGRSLRVHAARGTLVNALYQASLLTLSLLKGVVVAAFLTPSQYGVWGVLTISLMTILWLKQVGIADKYVQQDEHDQEEAFHKAFTLELLFTCGIALVFLLALPVFALIYGEWEIVAPGALMALAVAMTALQAPAWVFYRRMDFVRQRLLQGVDPVVSFVVTLALAVAGAGYWSLVLGVVAGALAASIACLAQSPHRIRLRYEPGTARAYVSFSWPLLVAGASSLVIAQGSIIAGDAEYGLAAVGAITLAATIAHYSDRMDAILTDTLYPAICAVRDRTDLLLESFVKSNRLALMWGMPFGVGLSLFAADLVHHGLGDDWEPAIVLLQVFGLTAAAGHIGFNWHAFYRARGDTRPIAVWSALTMLVFLAVPLPLLLTQSLGAFAAGIGVMTAVSLAVRSFYLARLFSPAVIARHAVRAIAPTVPAVAAVLGARALDGSRTLGIVLAELGLYLAVTVVATFAFERALLRESLGYLRGAGAHEARAAT